MPEHDSHIAQPLRMLAPPLTRRMLHEWWHADSGYREVLQLAWPLFLAQGSSTILQFIDRMFLTWFSPDAMAAAGTSGMLAITMQALFIGLAGYTSAFVAQYTGAGRPRQAVAVVWQACYLTLLAAVIMLFLVPVGAQVFRLARHTPALQQMERAFFTILLYGSVAAIGNAAVSAYFIGRGMTRVVLWVSLIGVAVNIVLDYLLIFGHAGFPRLGVSGAALATVSASTVSLLVAGGYFLRLARREHTRGAWRPDIALLGRLTRFGMANGVQFALEMLGWTLFLLLIGRLGPTALSASNLAFQVNSLAFFPIIGFAMAASTLVGKCLGRNRPDLANRAVWSAVHISVLFTAVMGLLFVGIPGWLLAPFGAEADPVKFAAARAECIVLLRFVAAYCLFDVGNLIFAASLKGAGDTLFVMFLSTGILSMLMLAPTLWCIRPGGWGLYGAWTFLTLAVCVLSVAFLLRYLQGRWREMRVIEREII